MSEFIDFEDKSVDKAVEKACQELNMTKDQLKYDIISYGSSGIFGLVGSRKALIRVVLHESSGNFNNTGDERRTASGTTDGSTDFQPVLEADDGVSAIVDETFGPKTENTADGDKDLSGNFSDFQEQAPNSFEIDDIIEWTRIFLEKTVQLVSPASGITFDNAGEVISFKITGGDAARLIGKKGQTLDAIQYLADKAIYNQFKTNIQVEIDVEGYLDKRKTELAELASKLAQKTRQTGKPMVINRINSHDRRFVHLALKEDKEIRTQSSGNGELRKLLILPKKKPTAKKNTS